MQSRCRVLAIDEIQAGAILAREVLDARGEMLLPAGAILTGPMFSSLARRGIERLAVVDSTPCDIDLDAERRRIDERMTILFRGSRGRAAEAIRRLVAEYRLRRLS